MPRDRLPNALAGACGQHCQAPCAWPRSAAALTLARIVIEARADGRFAMLSYLVGAPNDAADAAYAALDRRGLALALPPLIDEVVAAVAASRALAP